MDLFKDKKDSCVCIKNFPDDVIIENTRSGHGSEIDEKNKNELLAPY